MCAWKTREKRLPGTKIEFELRKATKVDLNFFLIFRRDLFQKQSNLLKICKSKKKLFAYFSRRFFSQSLLNFLLLIHVVFYFYVFDSFNDFHETF